MGPAGCWVRKAIIVDPKIDVNDPRQVEALVRELEKRALQPPPRRLGPWGRGFTAGLLVGLLVGAALPKRAEAAGLGVTAYCDSGVMADGRWTHPGAAASNYYPFGEVLYVRGWGEVTVEDRSTPGATYVDIYMPDCGDAWQWGREYVEVYDEGSEY